MITALIRLEARNVPGGSTTSSIGSPGASSRCNFSIDRCRKKTNTKRSISACISSQIASAVMRSHAVEGIRLDLKVDAYPVSVNVAMPTGLVVNELLTNALKHAFRGPRRRHDYFAQLWSMGVAVGLLLRMTASVFLRAQNGPSAASSGH